MITEPAPRYETREAIAKLRTVFDLPLWDDAQDWDLVCSDGERVEESLKYYETDGTLTEDDKFALMKLIISTLDHQIATTGPEPPLVERVRRQLASDFTIHEATIFY